MQHVHSRLHRIDICPPDKYPSARQTLSSFVSSCFSNIPSAGAASPCQPQFNLHVIGISTHAFPTSVFRETERKREEERQSFLCVTMFLLARSTSSRQPLCRIFQAHLSRRSVTSLLSNFPVWKRGRNVGDPGQRKMKWTRSNVSELNRIVLNRRYNLRSSRLRNWGTGEGSAELFSLLNYFLANHGIPARLGGSEAFIPRKHARDRYDVIMIIPAHSPTLGTILSFLSRFRCREEFIQRR